MYSRLLSEVSNVRHLVSRDVIAKVEVNLFARRVVCRVGPSSAHGKDWAAPVRAQELYDPST